MKRLQKWFWCPILCQIFSWCRVSQRVRRLCKSDGNLRRGCEETDGRRFQWKHSPAICLFRQHHRRGDCSLHREDGRGKKLAKYKVQDEKKDEDGNYTVSVKVEPFDVFQTLQQSSAEVSKEKIAQGMKEVDCRGI